MLLLLSSYRVTLAQQSTYQTLTKKKAQLIEIDIIITALEALEHANKRARSQSREAAGTVITINLPGKPPSPVGVIVVVVVMATVVNGFQKDGWKNCPKREARNHHNHHRRRWVDGT